MALGVLDPPVPRRREAAAGGRAGATGMRALARRLAAQARPHLTPAAPDPRRLILWLPVALGAGAAFYLSLPAEPDLAAGLSAAAALLAGLGAVMLASRGEAMRSTGFVLILAAAAAGGFALSEMRAERLAPPAGPLDREPRRLEGWIEAVERREGGGRALIRVTSLEGWETPPERVRLRLDVSDLDPGDGLVVDAALGPPPGPAAPGGYDAGRAAWFQGVALSGWAMSGAEPVALDGVGGWRRALARLRARLSERIAAQAGGVAAALLTGDRSRVSEADAEALRASGLGHILAISGLHMGLFAFAVYHAARVAACLVGPFARAHDPRKPAAAVALAAAAFYLLLSGAAVSTQRAFVVTAAVLIAVMIERRALSMRALALAATAILVTAPESVAQPGFQMSFAAAAILVAIFSRPRRPGPPPGPGGKAWRWVRDLSVVSLAAGAATGAFALAHFQRGAGWGFPANLLAMPVFTAAVMPAGALALALTPFGLEGAPLAVMRAGLDLVLAVAHAFASLPGAAMTAPAPAPAMLALYGFGYAAAVMGLGLARTLGAAVAGLAFCVWMLAPPPSVFVSEGGVVAARLVDTPGWSVSTGRRDRFDVEVFLTRAGSRGATPARGFDCDRMGCVGLTREGLRIAAPASADALAEDCEAADLVVARFTAPGRVRRACAAALIDAADLARSGGVTLRVREGRIVSVETVSRRRGARPWSSREAT